MTGLAASTYDTSDCLMNLISFLAAMTSSSMIYVSMKSRCKLFISLLSKQMDVNWLGREGK
jgi:hypothetical protein